MIKRLKHRIRWALCQDYRDLVRASRARLGLLRTLRGEYLAHYRRAVRWTDPLAMDRIKRVLDSVNDRVRAEMELLEEITGLRGEGWDRTEGGSK